MVTACSFYRLSNPKSKKIKFHFSKHGRNTSDHEEGSKARSSKSDSSETRKTELKPESKDETAKVDSVSSKDEVSSNKAPQPDSPSSNKGKNDLLTSSVLKL